MNSRRNSNSVGRMMLGIVLLASMTDSLAADDKDDWQIGRVFMSRAERLVLDKMRRSPQPTLAPPTTSSSNDTLVTPPTREVNPTGYILSSDGSPYRWEDGNFRKTSRESIVVGDRRGNIRIVKHERAATPDRAHNAAHDNAEQTPNSNSDRPNDHVPER